MKVTVKQENEEKIDFSKAGQYLISTNQDKRVILTTGKGNGESFCAIALYDCKNSKIKAGQIHDYWNGFWFKKFNGTITIEQ